MVCRSLLIPCVCIISCLFNTCVVSSPPSSLRLVSLLYRHGDRSPAYIYPKDKNTVEKCWPDGLGWLSNIGKEQQYELGKYIASRYDGFLNTSYYDNTEILVQSSAIDRCLMSAYSNLAGLYPPQGSQIWKHNFNWQPIPVHSVPNEQDRKLSENAPCPRYFQVFKEILNCPAIKKEEKENKKFYDMVEKETGIKKESIADIWKVTDALICERAHNYTWNSWVTPEVWAKLDLLRTWSFDLLFNNTELSRLKGGPLLKEMIENMKNATSKKNIPSPRFYMYSAHDTTVASLLAAMRVWDKHQPIYRSLVMVELHEIDDEYEVKIFYRNETDHDPYLLTPKGCGDPCKLEDFIDATKSSIPINWTEECKLKDVSDSNSSATFLTPATVISLTVGISLCLVILSALVYLAVKHKQNSRRYTRLR